MISRWFSISREHGELAQLDAVIETEAGVAHELHVLDVPDSICKERLRARSADGKHPYQVSEENYDLFTSYFVLRDRARASISHATYRPERRPETRPANFRAGPAYLADLVTYLRKIERFTARSREARGSTLRQAARRPPLELGR